MKENVVITVNGMKLTAFESVHVSRGIEHVPSSFEASTSDLPSQIPIKAGYPCTITTNGDILFTGFVDQDSFSIGNGHGVTFTGTSNFAQLVRNSAVLKAPAFDGDTNITLGCSLSGTVNSIATTLASPYNVKITGINSQVNVPVLQFSLGQTPYEIIENISRYAQLLVYDNVNGDLVFANVNTGKMASGFVDGQGLKEIAVNFDVSNRYSDYYAVMNAVDTVRDNPSLSSNFVAYSNDQGMKSLGPFKPLIFVSEQSAMNPKYCQQRCDWEKNRRYGRGQIVNCTMFGWRDSAGTLWEPNYSAVIDAPSVHITDDNSVNWVIASVDYLFSEGGTTSTVQLMPQEAFYVEPVSLDQEQWDLFQKLNPPSNPK